MITSWTVFLVVAITFIVLIMALTFFIMKKFKASLKIIIPIMLTIGLIVGGASFGYVSATQGSHFVVVNENLSTEFLFSLGENKYKLADGQEITIPKGKNLIINNSDKDLLFEEVVYGNTGKEPYADIIAPGDIYNAHGFLKSIYFFEDEPPETITTKSNSETKYWLTVYDEDAEYEEKGVEGLSQDKIEMLKEKIKNAQAK